jgi:hypothetical protein
VITLPWNSIMKSWPGRGGWIEDYIQQKPMRVDAYPAQIDSRKMIPCDAQSR